MNFVDSVEETKYLNEIEEHIGRNESELKYLETFKTELSDIYINDNFELGGSLATESFSNSLISQFPSSSSLHATSLNSAGSSTSSCLYPISPSSSGSSLSFPIELNTSSNFLASNQFPNIFDTKYNSFSSCIWNNQDNFMQENRKHDVSCGTEFSSSEPKSKKELQWLQNLKLPVNDKKNSMLNTKLNTNMSTFISTNDLNSAQYVRKQSSTESFRLVEKIQPKKSRTKYTKEQLSYLESAFAQGPYPDLILTENLCKTLEISKEKINIWFQNRRARSKRGGSKIKNINPTNASNLPSNLNQLNTRVITINNNNNIQSNSFNESPSYWSNNMSSFVSSVYEF